RSGRRAPPGPAEETLERPSLPSWPGLAGPSSPRRLPQLLRNAIGMGRPNKSGDDGQKWTSVRERLVDLAHVPRPGAVVELEQPFGGRDPAVGDLVQLAQVAAFVDQAAGEAVAALQPFTGDRQHVLGHVLHRPPA